MQKQPQKRDKFEAMVSRDEHVLVVGLVLLVMVVGEAPGGEADPRAQTVNFTCGTQLEHNSSVFVPNFVAVMENISDQMRVSGFGVAVAGKGPDANYGLAQCYGDLSLLDCVLCYAEARTVLPQCYPYNSGRYTNNTTNKHKHNL